MGSHVINRRRLAAVLLVALGAALALNVVGLMRYPGGPLRGPSADGWFLLDTRPSNQGTSLISAGSRAGLVAGESIYTGISLHNASSSSAVVEAFRLLEATPGLRLVDARLARPGACCDLPGLMHGTGPEIDELRLDTDYQPLPAPLSANNPVSDGRVALVVTATEPGDYSYQAVAVDYRVGPFSFTVVYHQALAVCLGLLPIGAVCSADSLYP